MTPSKTVPRVLISGAGIAGLTAALWLSRFGMRACVIERAPVIRADGFVISISHHAYRFAAELGLLPALHARAAGISASSYHRASGRTLLALDYARLFQGIDVLQIMRDDLENVLWDAARDIADFRFGVHAAAIGQDEKFVNVALTDGTADQWDIVIGADGLHSGVRALAFAGDDVRHHHLGLWSAAYRLPNVLGLRNKFETHMERDRYMVVFTTPEQELAAVFVWRCDGAQVPPQEQRHELLRARYADAPDVVRRVLDSPPESGGIYMDPLIQIDMPCWSHGRIVLVGDAAHCMTLLSGQGASAAMSGASRLARAIAREPTVSAAFNVYEDAMRPVIRDMQPRTRDAARWYVPRVAWRHVMRDAAMGVLPNWYFQRLFRSKYSKA